MYLLARNIDFSGSDKFLEELGTWLLLLHRTSRGSFHRRWVVTGKLKDEGGYALFEGGLGGLVNGGLG